MTDISLNSTGRIRPSLGGARYGFQFICGVRLCHYAGDLQHADWIDTRNSIQISRSAPSHCSRRGLLCGTFQCAGRHIVADNSADRDICDPAAAWISLHRAAQARRDAGPCRRTMSLAGNPEASIKYTLRSELPKSDHFALRPQNRQRINTFARDSGS